MVSEREEEMEKKANYIATVHSFRQKKVGIYCRVRTNDKEQLNSLINQISTLIRLGQSLMSGN